MIGEDTGGQWLVKRTNTGREGTQKIRDGKIRYIPVARALFDKNPYLSISISISLSVCDAPKSESSCPRQIPNGDR